MIYQHGEIMFIFVSMKMELGAAIKLIQFIISVPNLIQTEIL